MLLTNHEDYPDMWEALNDLADHLEGYLLYSKSPVLKSKRKPILLSEIGFLKILLILLLTNPEV
jgi:hypothetical protein